MTVDSGIPEDIDHEEFMEMLEADGAEDDDLVAMYLDLDYDMSWYINTPTHTFEQYVF